MEKQYTINREEYISAHELIQKTNINRYFKYLIIIVLTIISAISGANVIFIGIIVLFIVSIIDFIILRIFKRNSIRKDYYKYERYCKGPFNVTVSNENIVYNHIKISWEEIKTFLKNDDVFVIILINNAFFIFPGNQLDENHFLLLDNKYKSITNSQN